MPEDNSKLQMACNTWVFHVFYITFLLSVKEGFVTYNIFKHRFLEIIYSDFCVLLWWKSNITD